MVHVVHGRVVRDPAVAVDVHSAEADAVRARDGHRPRERLVAADHAVDVQVRHGTSGASRGSRAAARSRSRRARPRSAARAAPSWLHAVQLHLVAHVVLARHLVDASRRGRCRRRAGPACANVLGVQRSKNVPPPPSRHPQARVLAVPAAARSGSAVCALLYGFSRLPSRPLVPWPPRKRTSFIIECCARHPQRGDGPRVDAVRVEPDPDHDRWCRPGGASISAFGPPDPWNAGVLSGTTSWVALGCSPTRTVSGRSTSVSVTRYLPAGR